MLYLNPLIQINNQFSSPKSTLESKLDIAHIQDCTTDFTWLIRCCHFMYVQANYHEIDINFHDHISHRVIYDSSAKNNIVHILIKK